MPELILIAFVFLLFFGKSRLPGLAQSIGQSVKELRDGRLSNYNDTARFASDEVHLNNVGSLIMSQIDGAAILAA